MTGAGIALFSLISIVTLDILVRLLERQSRENTYFKPAGLFGLLWLATNKHEALLVNKPASIKRFIMALFASLCLIIAITVFLGQGFAHTKGMSSVIISLAPLMAMPFYHFLFAIVGNNFMAIYASISNFRLRGILALIMISNIVFVSLAPPSLLTKFVYLLMVFLALVYLFFLSSRIRTKPKPTDLQHEDYDCGPGSFLYYLSALIELFYCTILIYFVFLKDLTASYAPNQALLVMVPLSIASLYLATIISAKLLFIDRSPPSPDFYEDKLLPFSFLFFGLSFFYQSYF